MDLAIKIFFDDTWGIPWCEETLHLAGFSLGLDDMEGDLSPPYGGGQSSNRGGQMGRDIYFMGGTHTSNSF